MKLGLSFLRKSLKTLMKKNLSLILVSIKTAFVTLKLLLKNKRTRPNLINQWNREKQIVFQRLMIRMILKKRFQTYRKSINNKNYLTLKLKQKRSLKHPKMIRMALKIVFQPYIKSISKSKKYLLMKVIVNLM